MEVRKLTENEHFESNLISYIAFHMRLEDPEKMRAESRFVIRVEGDEQIAENNGTWEVDGDNAELTDKASDLTVSIQAFGQMAAGCVSLYEAMYRPDVTVAANEEVLSGVFVRKLVLAADHF